MQGIASAMIEHAKLEARRQGIAFLYVHVVLSNAAACQLYAASNFSVEQQETASFAHSLNRPQRKLLLNQL